MQLNTQTRTETMRSSVTMLIVVVVGITEAAAAAPQLLLQPLSSQLNSDTRGYATGYGYDGVKAPAVAVQLGKAVHYVDAPPPSAVVGYAPSYLYKPDLSAYAAASFPQVEQLRRFNPAVRPVHTVVPKVTAVEPSVAVQKTYVDVPVYRPAVAVQDLPPPPHYYEYQLIDRK